MIPSEHHLFAQFYAQLLRLYPRAYREEFAAEMLFVFNQQLAETQTAHSLSGWWSFGIRILNDYLRTLLTQHILNKGDNDMSKKHTHLTIKHLERLVIFTLAVLLIPLAGNLFIPSFNWTVSDFGIMAVLLFCLGLSIVVARLKIQNPKLAWMVVILLLGLGCWIYAELAVGLFTSLGS